jgi:succinate dehydrogenase hydrophobic anchor subunit
MTLADIELAMQFLSLHESFLNPLDFYFTLELFKTSHSTNRVKTALHILFVLVLLHGVIGVKRSANRTDKTFRSALKFINDYCFAFVVLVCALERSVYRAAFSHLELNHSAG